MKSVITDVRSFVRLGDRNQLSRQKELLRAAETSGWVHSEFVGFVENRTMGSAVLRAKQNLSPYLFASL
jgi:hypothetical protein